MGFMQRHTRSFFLAGIIVMILSLGSIFFATQLGSDDASAGDSAATATASPDDANDDTNDSSDDGITRSYAAAPELTIDPEAEYEAVIHLNSGDVRIELFADLAPSYVNNFVFLAQNQFYDGLTFHRVIPDFVAQTGDPSGSGFGSPGYTLEEETTPVDFERGALSMAKDATGATNGSQFFITLGATPWLNGDFTVFGEVTEGIELLDGLTPRDPAENPEQDGDTILSIEIIEREA
jgi:peptidylprolyl isomerase